MLDDADTNSYYRIKFCWQEFPAFEGVGQRTKIVLQRRMYRDEIPTWLSEADRENEDNPDGPGITQSPLRRGEPIPVSTSVSHNSPQGTPPSYVGTLNPNGFSDGGSINT